MNSNLLIRQARNSAGLLQKDLASMVGCSQQTVVDIESGKIKRSKYLADICDELGLDYKTLISGTASSQADLVAFDFGRPLPVIDASRVGAWVSGELVEVSGLPHLPCPVQHGPRSFAVQASGDSMDRDIRHNDIVHVDPGQGWKSGDVVCMFVGTKAAPIFRRLFAEGDEYCAVAARDDSRRAVRLVDRLSEVESSALALIDGTAIAYVAGKAIFSGRFYS